MERITYLIADGATFGFTVSMILFFIGQGFRFFVDIVLSAINERM